MEHNMMSPDPRRGEGNCGSCKNRFHPIGLGDDS
jgi:hypothetical protein